MSTAVAEQLPHTIYQPYLEMGPELPSQQYAFAATELETEEFARKKAERLIRTAGGIAWQGATEEPEYVPEKQTFASLHDALHEAKKGNQTALEMVRMNVSTDRFERTKKVQFVLSVELETNASDEILQHGQTNEQIQANTLQHCAGNRKMLPRYYAEVRNSYRLDLVKRQNLLEDYWFFVASPCADNMNDEELGHEGFFAPTKSMAFQATTVKDGKVVVESAFVAGVRDDESPRHDFSTLQTMGEWLGADLTGTASEIIDEPILIPKSLMPNGVIDIVKLYDDAAGGTFFGEDKPRQDYIEFLATCQKERDEAEGQVTEMMQKLLARAHESTDPVAASRLLSDVVGKFMAEAATHDERIDPRVFGVKAAYYIADARAHIATGDIVRAQQATRLAVKTEQSSSCPGGVKNTDDMTEGNAGEFGVSDILSKKEDSIDDCDFVSKECPMCHAKNVKTTVRSGVYYGECGCDSKHGRRQSHTAAAPVQHSNSNVISLTKKKQKKDLLALVGLGKAA